MFGKYNLLTSVQASRFGIKTSGGVLLRPEDFSISNNDGQKGTIQKISFWGSFYEAEILLNDLKLVVRLSKNEWEVGEEVFVTSSLK
jgi:iron(III) transport system ATP-binding protein